MATTLLNKIYLFLNPTTVRHLTLRSSLRWRSWIIGIIALSSMVGLLMMRNVPELNFATGVWFLYLLGIVAIMYQPRWGIYLIVTLALFGDHSLTPWYPFDKNFSSPESIFFVHDLLIISPLELYLIVTLVSWLIRKITNRQWRIHIDAPFWTAALFTAFITFGLVYGFNTGGDRKIALWEARFIYYLIIMLVMTSNLLKERKHAITLMWSAVLGIFLEGLTGTYFVLVQLRGSMAGTDGITEHSAAIHMNTVFVFFAAIWIYKVSAAKRLLLLSMLPFIIVPYIATQRRSAFVTLGLALLLMVFLLYKENKLAFGLITPPLAMIGFVYMAAFWNSGGALGLPARAVRSIIAPDQAGASDYSSNLYRILENFNIAYTIHLAPWTGVGFGHKFFIAVPMADISFFDWWEYFTHNSIIWIWVKTGVGGFISLLYLVGNSLMVGARVLWRMPSNELRAIAVTATLYILMHFGFAYVDMSWSPQNMVYLGAMIGLLAGLERIVTQNVPLPRKRWPWQSNPEPALMIRPLSEGVSEA